MNTRSTEIVTTTEGGHTLELYTFFTTKEYNSIKMIRLANKDVMAGSEDNSMSGKEAMDLLEAFTGTLIARLDGESDKGKIKEAIDNMPANEGEEIGTICAKRGSELFFSVMTSSQKSPTPTPQLSGQDRA